MGALATPRGQNTSVKSFQNRRSSGAEKDLRTTYVVGVRVTVSTVGHLKVTENSPTVTDRNENFKLNHHLNMASVSSLTRQISALAISSKKPTTAASKPPIDIGKYDGGLELDNESRGERVYGQAAEELALNSSLSR